MILHQDDRFQSSPHRVCRGTLHFNRLKCWYWNFKQILLYNCLSKWNRVPLQAQPRTHSVKPSSVNSAKIVSRTICNAATLSVLSYDQWDLFLHMRATRHDIWVPYLTEIPTVCWEHAGPLGHLSSIFTMYSTVRGRNANQWEANRIQNLQIFNNFTLHIHNATTRIAQSNAKSHHTRRLQNIQLSDCTDCDLPERWFNRANNLSATR